MSSGMQRIKELRESGNLKDREYLNPIEKTKLDPKSLRKAINAKCYECMGCGDDAGWRKAIADCTGYSCPLYHQRPYQNMVD
jgi:hypothetical protein